MTAHRDRSRNVTVPAAVVALTIGAVATVVFELRRRFLRYEVRGHSMMPALDPGDWVIVDRTAYRRRFPRKGEIVLARDPRDPAREIVKRVDHTDLHGGVWLAGDNPAASTASETFGPVSRGELIGRVRWRYWPLHSLLRVR